MLSDSDDIISEKQADICTVSLELTIPIIVQRKDFLKHAFK